MNEWLFYLAKVVYLMLPGIFANIAPVLVKGYFRWMAAPVSVRLFGSHKTYRGFVFGILFAIVVVFLQGYLFRLGVFSDFVILDYGEYNLFLLGFLFGFGVLFGDLVKSFFKRRVGIKPGGRFVPWDQIDSAVGAILFVSIVYPVGLGLFFYVVVLSFILHIIVKHIGYYIGVNKGKW